MHTSHTTPAPQAPRHIRQAKFHPPFCTTLKIPRTPRMILHYNTTFLTLLFLSLSSFLPSSPLPSSLSSPFCRLCPPELKESVCSVIYCAPYLESDAKFGEPELMKVRGAHGGGGVEGGGE